MLIGFFVDENVGNWHPRTHGTRNYLQSFYLAALVHKYRKKINIHMLSIEILLETEGQDHFIKKVITMELICCLLMMNSQPNIRKALYKIKRPSSMNLWSVKVMMLVQMMYGLILNQNCDQMEFIPHLLLLGKFLLP